MRRALSLIAIGAAALSVSAYAQEPVPVTPPVAEPAEPAPSPAVQAPAVAAPETATPAPAAPEAAPAAAEAEPAPVAPTPPPAPTDPVNIAVIETLERICMPMVAVRSEDVKGAAAPFGYKARRGIFTKVVQKPYQLTIQNPGSNTHVCTVDVDHAIGGADSLTVDLHNWAQARGYGLVRNDQFTTDMQRHTRSWELTQPGQLEALVLVTTRNTDGSPMLKNADRSTVIYSLQKTQ